MLVLYSKGQDHPSPKSSKVNVDLYSALSWSHQGAQVWHALSRDLTVLPAHPTFIR